MKLLFIFPFLITLSLGLYGQITNDTISNCESIKREVDDFTNEITLHSPYILSTDYSKMIIYKIVNNNKSLYFLDLNTIGITYNVGGKGVIIIFEDGTKLNKPNENITTNIDSEGYKYSAFITVTESELQILSTKKIKKFRLYIYDQEIEYNEDAELFAQLVKCIIKMK